jgi:hypothetical protein
MVYKTVQILPVIKMTVSFETEIWLLNERKRQQQEDDKMKKSLGLNKSIAEPNDKESSNFHMPNQYSREKCSERGGCNQG